jgi:HSP20 family protein
MRLLHASRSAGSFGRPEKQISACKEWLVEATEMTAQSATAMQSTKGSVPIKRGTEDLLTEFDRIYDSITRRAFEMFEGNGGWFGHDLDDWFRAEAELLHPLPLEVKESEGDFTVRAEVPGFTAKDLEISLEPRSLKIAGKRESKEEEKKGKTICSEFRADQIMRAIDLLADFDTSKASAVLKDGVLTIDLPKAVHAKAVRIEPKAA